MRIIGGTCRGKKLAAVPGTGIRPTSDRLRESIFNIIAHTVPNAVVLDLFAGTGAMGIEALSRGAKWATFLDRDKTAVRLINRNLTECRLTNASHVITWDITRNLDCLRADNAKFNLVFVDPPYSRGLLKPALSHLVISDALADNADIVVEHDPGETIPDDLALEVVDQRSRSKTTVTFLRSMV